METRAHYVLIGLFTVIVVLAALVFGLWLAKNSTNQAFNDYNIVFNEAVSGLSQGGDVQYNGIKVGSVTQLKLDPNDPRRVLARIRLDGDAPVKQDTHAKLALTGITGLAVIQLTGGSPQSAKLVGVNGAVPTIVADPSPLAKLLANGADIMVNINEVAARAALLLSPENIQHVQHTLDHLDQATSAIADERGDIRTMLQQLAQASGKADATLAQAQELAHNMNGLIDGPARATLASAQASMASLNHATASIDHLLNDNHDALNNGLQGVAELGPAIRELRSTLVSLRGISRQLDNNPSGYLLGRNKTREFVP